MTDLHAQALAVIDAEIRKAADFFDSVDDIYTAQSVIDEENVHLRFILTLKAVLELHKDDGYGECDSCEIRNYPCPNANLIIKGVLG